ncbi:CHRD domain protein [Arthrobacter ulcerisalmonis]|uniref:CHRD domain protein n=2 Tax=Arthrobacter ulcerisalmonis TaxID=2483813 RepID=A0A3P5X2E7_9MICC|nr:CHRD domain-containing protein [Arthrobacter ulcerisalmonis]VDC22427.1 CHRD domain protein [Arthrobacter ulcerisalmonis]
MKTLAKKRIAAFTGTAGAMALAALVAAAPASAETTVDRPDSFTSMYSVQALPENVVGPDGAPAPGEPGAWGTFNFMINSDLDVICYDISLTGVTGPYQSAAKTATHIHQAVQGKNGPPRLAFPNPVGEGNSTSAGCLKGPFTTGLKADNGTDTGEGFTLKQIEANPSGFSADTHTAAFVPGAVRGQLAVMPAGGVDTGIATAATASADPGAMVTLAVGTLGAAAVGTLLLVRSRKRAS